jgi:multidrug efflux pump subunit AcrB
MQKNVGGVDKILRVAVGLAIIIIGFLYKSWWGLIGLLPLAIALIGWCPLYSIIGVCTIKGCSCKVKSEVAERR